MGAKTWMLVYADGDPRDVLRRQPGLDREAAAQFAAMLFPDETLTPFDDGTLSFTNPPDDELIVGCFPGLSIVAAGEFGIDYPTRLPASFLEAGRSRNVYLHAMHSVVDWFAFAWWQNGTLRRALSLSPDSGVLEDIGERLPFEVPYWEGLHPAVEDIEVEPYPFPFDPLELGEAALKEFFGYQIEGRFDASQIDPESVPLMQFKRRKRRGRPWWKFWR